MKSCVLLAARETATLEFLPIVLQAAGHQVQIAASGLDALNKARRSLPNLIILDAVLPDMDGATACEILSRLPSTTSVPRILLTAPQRLQDSCVPTFNSAEIVRRVNQALFQNSAREKYAAFCDMDSSLSESEN